MFSVSWIKVKFLLISIGYQNCHPYSCACPCTSTITKSELRSCPLHICVSYRKKAHLASRFSANAGRCLERKRHKPTISNPVIAIRPWRNRIKIARKILADHRISRGGPLLIGERGTAQTVHGRVTGQSGRVRAPLSYKRASRLRWGAWTAAARAPLAHEDSTRRGTSCRLKTKEQQECKGRNVIAATTPSSFMCDSGGVWIHTLLVVVIVMSRALRTYGTCTYVAFSRRAKPQPWGESVARI